MSVRRSDLRSLARKMREAGRLLDERGDTAWTRTRDWQHGPRATNLDPDTGGRRTEEVDLGDGPEIVDIPSHDPTGEAVIRGLPADTNLHDTYRRTLDQVGPLVEQLADILGTIAPDNYRRPGRATPADVEAERLCGSCWRIGEVRHELTHPDGRAKYRGRCQFCGPWRSANNGEDPPLPILKAHHRGQRITPSLVARLTRRTA